MRLQSFAGFTKMTMWYCVWIPMLTLKKKKNCTVLYHYYAVIIIKYRTIPHFSTWYIKSHRKCMFNMESNLISQTDTVSDIIKHQNAATL